LTAARTALHATQQDALHATTLADQTAANRAWSAAYDAAEAATTQAERIAIAATNRAWDTAGDVARAAQAAYDTAWAAAMTALGADRD
jgi:hypothetical protein